MLEFHDSMLMFKSFISLLQCKNLSQHEMDLRQDVLQTCAHRKY